MEDKHIVHNPAVFGSFIYLFRKLQDLRKRYIGHKSVVLSFSEVFLFFETNLSQISMPQVTLDMLDSLHEKCPLLSESHLNLNRSIILFRTPHTKFHADTSSNYRVVMREKMNRYRVKLAGAPLLATHN